MQFRIVDLGVDKDNAVIELRQQVDESLASVHQTFGDGVVGDGYNEQVNAINGCQGLENDGDGGLVEE